MKAFIVFASLLVVIGAVSEEEAWTDFKQSFAKQYRSLREEQVRFKIFKTNLESIQEHNARYETGEESYTMGVNQFADLSDEEFRETYLGLSAPVTDFIGTFEIPENVSASSSVDWREEGAVRPVKDQGSCGSCWAFSAIGALEGQNAILKNVDVDLSEQELLDCAGEDYYNAGCDGGLMTNAFVYLKDYGISTASSYPYVGREQRCANTRHSRANIKIRGYRNVAASESALQAAVATVGPIAVAIEADKIRFYTSGIFDNVQCGYDLDHAVLAVGYGKASNKDYWIVKNSWGTSWGENGYIRMRRNRNNQCGIAFMTSYPVIV